MKEMLHQYDNTLCNLVRMNGYKLQADEQDAEEYTVHVVNEKPAILEISNWIREHMTKRS